MKTYALVMASVAELVVTVLAFLFLGGWADKHFMTGSRYTSVGAILGCVMGFTRLVMRLKGSMDGPGDDQP